MIERRARLKAYLKRNRIESFLITNPVNIYYISGFKSEDSGLLVAQDGNFIITDFRYKEEAREIEGFQTRLIDGGFRDTLKRLVQELKIDEVWFEADALPYSKADILKKSLGSIGIAFKPCSGVIEKLRMIKDESEIAQIRRACKTSAKALAVLQDKITPGMTEKELARELDESLKKFGADKNAFDTIVASGKNSSRPHAVVTERKLCVGELVLVDFGAAVNSYHCDLTRIFILGKIQRLLCEIYAVCKEAQRRAIEKIKPGIPIKAIDAAARGYIASRGLGKKFGHSLGHGVGLEVHELPHISRKTDLRLRPNMVFTVEPGIYIAGVGGVRIEDMVLVTKTGCEVLTNDIPK